MVGGGGGTFEFGQIDQLKNNRNKKYKLTKS